MGIQVEFNPDLALRNIEEFKAHRRGADECIPEQLVSGHSYAFRKKGQRNYWLLGEIPLLETMGNQHLSRPLASIRIIEATHYIEDGEVWTRGRYMVVETIKPGEIRFNGFATTR
ncbi:hypothetical protein HZC53_01810 [Candidatus Uhrbacteria bacterium]|nr:hypothetical protein [Candidatus Uhrbacteria bacterium]